MVKQAQKVRRQEPTNYMSVFDPDVGLALKSLVVALFHFALLLKSS